MQGPIMSDDDLERLADALAARVTLRLPAHACHFDSPRRDEINALLDRDRKFQARKVRIATKVTDVVLTVLVGSLVVGVMALIGRSILLWIREGLAR